MSPPISRLEYATMGSRTNEGAAPREGLMFLCRWLRICLHAFMSSAWLGWLILIAGLGLLVATTVGAEWNEEWFDASTVMIAFGLVLLTAAIGHGGW